MREAVIHIPHRALETQEFGGVVSLAREAGLRDLSEIVCQSPGCILALTVEERLDEETFAAQAAVDWLERIEETAESVVYLCELRPESVDTVETDDGAVSSRELDVDEDGMDVSLVGPQSAIAEAVATYEGAGVSPSLERLGDFEAQDGALDSLTERQRTVVETAHELGYYDVPRTATTDDVAKALELDSSTVTEHLQRAERNLFGQLLGER